MNKKIFDQVSISFNETILNALKQMDLVKKKLLLVVTEKNDFYGLLSIGDIQRAIINNISLSEKIYKIMRSNVKIARTTDNLETMKNIMKERHIEFMPVLDESNAIVDIIFWEDLFDSTFTKKQSNIKLPVVIMAGGEGTRLRPLTNILPKPLIPIGKQTIIEDIMDKFINYSCDEFIISLNYKAEVIKNYLNNVKNKKYKITYIQEDKPSGTAGSLALLKEKIHTTFFVTNCDIIIDEDYSNILEYHRDSNNEITIVAAIKNFSVPYGTLETRSGGKLEYIHEKPTFNFKINTGMYILEPGLLQDIPSNGIYHITTLIERLCKEKRNVGVFPISEGSWIDIGNWDEYMEVIKKIEK